MLHGTPATDTLDAPRYCCADAARLVGLSPGQVRRYLRGYTYKSRNAQGGLEARQRPALTRPHKAGADEPYASFLDLADLLIVRKLLDRRFTLHAIRGFIEDVWRLTESTHVANERFYTLDRSAFIQLVPTSGAAVQELGKAGQLSLFREYQLDRLNLEFEARSGLALRWFPSGKRGKVMLDPHISFGRPVLTSANIPTYSIYDLYLGENKDAAAVARWYDISQRDVEAALEYQRRLAA